MIKFGSLFLTRKCKEDFAHSLDGIKKVTSDFLTKINNLFPHQLTFHLTCDSQQEQMEKIRNKCTNLSKDVENKFQLYLDNVGSKVSVTATLYNSVRCDGLMSKMTDGCTLLGVCLNSQPRDEK